MKHSLLMIIACCLLLSCAGSRQSVQQRPEVPEAQRRLASYVFGEAARQHAHGYLPEAYELLHSTLRLNPYHSPALSLLATYEQYLRHNDKADSLLAQAIRLDPTNIDYMEQEAACADRSNNIERIVASYERLAQARPRNIPLLWHLSQLYLKTAQPDKAIGILNQIENIQGADEQTASIKHRIHLAQGDSTSAMNDLRSLACDNPNDIGSQVLLANAYLNVMHDNDSAQAIFDRVAAIDPSNPALQMAQLNVYEHSDSAQYNKYFKQLLYANDTDEKLRELLLIKYITQQGYDSLGRSNAIAAFDRVTALPQESSRLLSTYATYLLDIDVKGDTLNKVLNKIIDIEPANKAALMQLLQNYANDNNSREVARICDIGITNYPHESIYYYYSALGYYIENDTTTALERVTTGCEHIDDNTSTHIAAMLYELQGNILHEMGRNSEAYAAYDNSLLYDPDNIMCLNNYAYYLSIEGGDLKKAEEMSYRTIRKEPDNRTYLDTYAWILYMQQRYEEAANYMDRVMQGVDPSSEIPEEISPVILQHAADIYEKAKR